jgi:hypothetical protein
MEAVVIISVGSLSPVKLEAIRTVMAARFPEAEFRPVSMALVRMGL